MMNNPRNYVTPYGNGDDNRNFTPVSDKEVAFCKAMTEALSAWGKECPQVVQWFDFASKMGIAPHLGNLMKLAFYSGAVWGQTYEAKHNVGELSRPDKLSAQEEVLFNVTQPK